MTESKRLPGGLVSDLLKLTEAVLAIQNSLTEIQYQICFGQNDVARSYVVHLRSNIRKLQAAQNMLEYSLKQETEKKAST